MGLARALGRGGFLRCAMPARNNAVRPIAHCSAQTGLPCHPSPPPCWHPRARAVLSFLVAPRGWPLCDQAPRLIESDTGPASDFCCLSAPRAHFCGALLLCMLQQAALPGPPQPLHTTSDLLRLLAADAHPFAAVAEAVAARFGGTAESQAWLARTLVTLLRVRPPLQGMRERASTCSRV